MNKMTETFISNEGVDKTMDEDFKVDGVTYYKNDHPIEMLQKSFHYFRKILCDASNNYERVEQAYKDFLTDYMRTKFTEDAKQLMMLANNEYEFRAPYFMEKRVCEDLEEMKNNDIPLEDDDE